MKPPPHNRNVPSHVWDDAVRQYEAYKRLYDTLRGVGCDDARADAYLTAHDELERALELLDPSEPDFSHDDHTGHFQRADAALAAMRQALGYPQRVKSA